MVGFVEDGKESNKFLYVSILSISTINFVYGVANTWTSPVLPKLMGKEGPSENPFRRPITVYEESYVTSLLFAGGMIGPILVGFFLDVIGRKRTLLLAGLPIFAAYLITAFANRVEYFYVGRFLLGLGYGPCIFITFLYVGEVSKPSNRGILGYIMAIMWRLGKLSSYSIGPYTSVQTFSLICLIPLIIFYLTFGIFIPDTPYYHILRQDFLKAKESLQKLRGCENVDEELDEIVRNVEEFPKYKTNPCYFWRSRSFVKGLVIISGLFFFVELTGFTVLLSYTESFFHEVSHSLVSSKISPIIAAVIEIISYVVAIPMVERLGRKFLLLSSLVGVLVALSMLGTYFYLQSVASNHVDKIFWLPLFAFALLTFFQNIGIGPLPWLYLSELFTSDVKAIAASFATSVCLLSDFISSELFPILKKSIGTYYCFMLFALMAVLEILFTIFIVPETKGKTLLHIQIELTMNNI